MSIAKWFWNENHEMQMIIYAELTETIMHRDSVTKALSFCPTVWFIRGICSMSPWLRSFHHNGSCVCGMREKLLIKSRLFYVKFWLQMKRTSTNKCICIPFCLRHFAHSNDKFAIRNNCVTDGKCLTEVQYRQMRWRTIERDDALCIPVAIQQCNAS